METVWRKIELYDWIARWILGHCGTDGFWINKLLGRGGAALMTTATYAVHAVFFGEGMIIENYFDRKREILVL